MLASRPDLADQAVDEVIRWCPAAPIVYRFAAQDFDFHDLRVDEDMFLTMSWRPPMGFHGPNALPLRFSENLGQELRETR